MLEVYSKNITVAEDAPIALNNVALEKGCSTCLRGVSTIQLNKCGVYEVTVSASAVADVAGVISIQLEKDGVLQPQAISSATAADTTSINPLGFTTLVQSPRDNSACPCAAPTTFDIVNTGVAATYDSIDVTVVRI